VDSTGSPQIRSDNDDREPSNEACFRSDWGSCRNRSWLSHRPSTVLTCQATHLRHNLPSAVRPDDRWNVIRGAVGLDRPRARSGTRDRRQDFFAALFGCAAQLSSVGSGTSPLHPRPCSGRGCRAGGRHSPALGTALVATRLRPATRLRILPPGRTAHRIVDSAGFGVPQHYPCSKTRRIVDFITSREA